ncbi:hypothetical protein [Streptomyces sp. NPDC021096]|uniref:hypothetical protein n=1 Tax=Streptomyces sp. NPDC021096 TaxID=3154792 RepID=UPI0033C230B0
MSVIPSTSAPLPSTRVVPTPSAPPVTVVGSVPARLVGEWVGDTKPGRIKRITFSAEGNCTLQYSSGLVMRGPVVVQGSLMTFSIPGGPWRQVTYRIERLDDLYGYSFENLILDGSSYVRQVGGAP